MFGAACAVAFLIACEIMSKTILLLSSFLGLMKKESHIIIYANCERNQNLMRRPCVANCSI